MSAGLTLPPPQAAFVMHEADEPRPTGALAQHRPSLAQQRFWVLDRLNPGDPALNVAVRWRIEGQLPTAVIAAAFEIIVARHEPLRTSFGESDGEPVQLVHPRAAPHVPSIDLTVLRETDAVAECDTIARAEAVAPFNVAIAPLIRVTHVKVRGDLAFLLVTAHHTVCDGWSIGVLARELGEICDALQTGRAPSLPSLPISYGGYTEAQRGWVDGGGLSDDLEFWAAALNGLEYAELPPDLPRPQTVSSAGAICSLLLDRGLTDGFASFARGRGCTMFTAMLSVLATLLHRYTEATDIAIGTQIAGRNQVDVENLVGLFINTVVLRVDLSDDPMFADLLDQASGSVADALEHGETPLEKVIETMKPKRQPGFNALFSVNFIFQRSFIENRNYSRFSIIDVPSYSAGAMYDLNFFMVERPEGWRISCEYNTTLYRETTINQLLKHFIAIASAASANPRLRLSEIPILDDDDRKSLLPRPEIMPTSLSSGRDLPRMIDEQAARTPAAIAVVDDIRSLTYAEVSRRSTALARRLLARGLGGGKRLGVFLPRTADLVIAPLGVMKAGSAYVPLDPVYPAARLQAIVEQSDLAAIIVCGDDAPPGLADLPLIALDDPPDADEAGGNPHPPPLAPESLAPESLAYVIFTSGSTGRPKGVQIPHRALTNFTLSMQASPGIGALDTVLALTTLCFDIAALELFVPLSVGARVVIATGEQTQDGARLLSLIQRTRVNFVQATPTTWRMLIEAGWQGAPRLRMLCGGEALPQDLADQLLQRSPELWNMYGPTETTIWSSANRLSPGEPAVCIGAPIANTQLYVMDKHQRLAPPGAVGELVIGGQGVGLGYWRMPEATAERFIPDPFSATPGAMLYRTGDLVRMRALGRLVFLGRKDDQVKIRGYRVELGDIEAALRRHAEVRNAVAVTHAGRDGGVKIHAYVELAGESALRSDEVIEELRRETARSLPSYMRPTRLSAMTAMPRLPNGKLDRKSLSQAGVSLADARAPQETPSSTVAARVGAIWCDVLGLERIDGDADFFELGGQSLLAARMLARVEAAFGRRIELSALFHSPTLLGFAKLLQSTDLRDFDFRQVVRLKPRDGRPAIFAINNTGLFVPLSRRLGEDLSLTGLQLFDPRFYHQPMPATLEEIAARYAKLVIQLQAEGPYVLLGFCDSGILAFETARQLEAATGARTRVVVIDTWAPKYLHRLGAVRSRVAAWSYRWQSFCARLADPDHRARRLRQVVEQGWLRRLRPRRPQPDRVADPDYESAERYDKWLNEYLGRMVGAYEPKPMSGAVMVVRGSREPSGWLLDMGAGWQPLAGGGVDLVTVPGDHTTIFKNPGVSLMARHIQRVVLRDRGSAPGAPARSGT